ncbi:MAG: phosphatase PAP2 family protein [bacterium]
MIARLSRRFNRMTVLIFITALITVLITDAIVCRIIKTIIARPRPPYDDIFVRLLINTTNSPSMPSAHASDSFATFTFTYIIYRRWALILLPLAILVSYSRVYVGVHYPFDIIVGAIIGSIFGILSAVILKVVARDKI